MAPPYLTLNEFTSFTYLVTWLNALVPAGTMVVRGQPNRVAEPKAANFVVAWPLRYARLGTNQSYYYDNIATGSIANNLMTIAEMTQQQGEGIQPGMVVSDGTGGLVDLNTQIVNQVSGVPGMEGVYTLNKPLAFPTGRLLIGARYDMVPTEWVVQCDCHGPNSANVAQSLFGLFRSEVATMAFEEQQSTPPYGSICEPMWSDEARYIPFVNAEQQYEYRWSVDVHAQVNPTLITLQQFADQLHVTLIASDLIPIYDMFGHMRTGDDEDVAVISSNVATTLSRPTE